MRSSVPTSRSLNSKRKAAAMRADYDRAALALTKARTAAAEALGRSVTALMRGLGMPGGVFEIAVGLHDGPPDPAGRDVIEFLVSANPGQPTQTHREGGLRR
jgi:DNA repair protein RecN (Recombination protein N)